MSKPNWKNQTIWTGDNLPIMRGMNAASVDLIYLDPPFNSKANYAAPIGSKAAGAEFKDTWTLSDVNVEWVNLIETKHPALYRVLLAAMTDSDRSYLIYMAARLLEMERLLKPTGSIYLHCDPTMSHYLKLVMDAVFGWKNFRNEIVWHYGQRTSFLRNKWCSKHDLILFYSGPKAGINPVPLVWDENDFMNHRHDVKTDDDGNEYVWTDGGKGKPRYKRMVSDILAQGKPHDDVWDFPIVNSSARERTGYPTQKPLALLDRIVKASSDKGTVVFDPFCGCATTLVAAAGLDRQWIGIDISTKAADLVVRRIEQKQGLWREIVHRTDIPQRTDLGKLPRYNSPENRRKLYGMQEGNCAGCRDHFEARHLEVDHIISRKKGGTDHSANLQLLCGNCNRVKGDRGMDYLKSKLQIR